MVEYVHQGLLHMYASVCDWVWVWGGVCGVGLGCCEREGVRESERE